MCPDLVLKRSPILPPFLCFPSASPSPYFSPPALRTPLSAWTSSIRPAAWEDKPGGQTRRTAADNTRLTSTPPPQSHSEAELYAPAHRSGRRQQDRRLPLFCKSPALLSDNSSMEPAEWDGSNPRLFPKLECRDRRGVAQEGRWGPGSEDRQNS